MISRRLALTAAGLTCLTCLAPAGPAAAADTRRPSAPPLRLGVDDSLVDSGLAAALTRAFTADTGIPVQLVPRPARPMLEALDRGEIDAALGNAPELEARLEKEGLIHDRRIVAHGEFVLVGPALRGKAGVASAGLVAALRGLRDAAPGTATFLSAAEGSAAHAIEQSAWREAQITPAAPWFVAGAASADPRIAQARARGAYALVERGAWLAQGGAPLAVRVQGDPLLREAVHAMRGFRVSHPAGKIFVAWVAGPQGRRVVAAQRGYRAPAG